MQLWSRGHQDLFSLTPRPNALPPSPIASTIALLQCGPCASNPDLARFAQVGVSGGGANDARALLDEQALAGDPSSGKGGNVVTDWFMGYVTWYYQPECGQGEGGYCVCVTLMH